MSLALSHLPLHTFSDHCTLYVYNLSSKDIFRVFSFTVLTNVLKKCTIVGMKKHETVVFDRDRLVRARGDKKPAEVARAIQISRQHLCDIEKGRRIPSLVTATLLCDEYGIPLESVIKKISNGTP